LQTVLTNQSKKSIWVLKKRREFYADLDLLITVWLSENKNKKLKRRKASPSDAKNKDSKFSIFCLGW